MALLKNPKLQGVGGDPGMVYNTVYCMLTCDHINMLNLMLHVIIPGYCLCISCLLTHVLLFQALLSLHLSLCLSNKTNFYTCYSILYSKTIGTEHKHVTKEEFLHVTWWKRTNCIHELHSLVR